jgi:hypothetical protein
VSDVDALANRLTTLRHADHPLGLDATRAAALTQALRGGTEVHVALAQVANAGGLPKLLEVAKPGDALAVTDRLLTPLAEVTSQRRALRSMAAYPTVVLVTVVLAALVTQLFAAPAMRTFSSDVSTVLNERLMPASFLFAVVMLVLLVVSIALEVPFSPLRWVVRGVHRVLTLEAVAVLAEDGVPMHRAFEAAAELANDDALRRASLDVAAALSAGRAPGANALFDETSGRLVFAAASRGVGGPVTRTLARHAGISAKRAVSLGGQGVQLVALLFAGLALLAVAASWFMTYSAALTVGA